MFNSLPGRIKWPPLSTRICLILVGIGLSIEGLVILFHIIIKRFQETATHLFGLHFSAVYGFNAIVGFWGTVVLAFGVICLIHALKASRRATLWGYAACACILLYKMLDVMYSFEMLCLEDLFGLPFEIDVLVLNLLLIASTGMLLTAMVCALLDLHNAEQTLQERNRALDREIQERRLLSIAVQNAAESILITDASGSIQYINPAFETLTGFTANEAKGRNPSILKSGKHDAAYYQELWNTIASGNVWRGRFTNKRKNGELFTEEATISAIQDTNNTITHYVAVKRDVTRETLLEQQALQSQKLEAIGTLAGGIAHDLNNVLAVIIGHSEISMGRLAADHPVRKSLEVIMRTSERSSQLIKRLLVFSRQDATEPKPMKPAPLIKEQMKVIRSYLPTNISIADTLESETGYILGEPIEIQQILFNLCTNANHAMQPDGGSLEIGLDCVEIEQEETPSAGTLTPGKYVHLYAQDSGCGMDQTVQSRLFEPFFTTKEVGMGTGLGLPMVHGSVMRSGGAITVASTPGKGARFDIYWPQLNYKPEEKMEFLEIPDGNGQRVLVVDDLVDFKELMEATLVVHGFEPVGFTDTSEALAYFQANSDTIDIALVDYMMPGMNGSDLASYMHDIKPGLPVVLVSGYSCHVTKDNAAEHGFAAVINKPVETTHLICTISRCLA